MGEIPYRDPLAAAQARIEALEAELRAISAGEGGVPVPPELADVIAPGERLLWHARPRPPTRWPRPAGAAALVGYLAAAGSVAFIAIGTLRGLPLRPWATPLALAIVTPLAVLLRRWRLRRRMARTRYALTDRRLLMVVADGARVRSLPLADIGTSLLELDGHDRGTLHIRLGDGAAFMLPGVPQAARAARLLEAARDRARSPAPER